MRSNSVVIFFVYIHFLFCFTLWMNYASVIQSHAIAIVVVVLITHQMTRTKKILHKHWANSESNCHNYITKALHRPKLSITSSSAIVRDICNIIVFVRRCTNMTVANRRMCAPSVVPAKHEWPNAFIAPERTAHLHLRSEFWFHFSWFFSVPFNCVLCVKSIRDGAPHHKYWQMIFN